MVQGAVMVKKLSFSGKIERKSKYTRKAIKRDVRKMP